MAAGFIANRISPLNGSTTPVSAEPTVSATPTPAEPTVSAEPTVMKIFNVDEKMALDIIELFTLDESEYAKKDKVEANDKLKVIYEVIKNCPSDLKKECSVIDTKIRNIAFMFGNTSQDKTEPLGDQSVVLNKLVNEFRKNKK